MVFVLVDGEIGPTKLDVQMLEWLRYNGVPHTVVATKMDKVKSSKRGDAPQGPRRRVPARDRRHRVGERHEGRRHRCAPFPREDLDGQRRLKRARVSVAVWPPNPPTCRSPGPACGRRPTSISNAELVESLTVAALRFNEEHAAEIEAGTVAARALPDEEFIVKASGIRSRHVMDKAGVLDPDRMRPHLELAAGGPARDPGRDGDAGDRAGAGPGRPHRRRRRRRDRRLLEPAARLSGRGDRDPGRARRGRLGLRHERCVLVRRRSRSRPASTALRNGSASLRGGREPGDHLRSQQLRAARLPLHLRRRVHRGRARAHRRCRCAGSAGRCSARSWRRSSRTTSATTSGSSTRSEVGDRDAARARRSGRTGSRSSTRCARWCRPTSSTTSRRAVSSRPSVAGSGSTRRTSR